MRVHLKLYGVGVVRQPKGDSVDMTNSMQNVETFVTA